MHRACAPLLRVLAATALAYLGLPTPEAEAAKPKRGAGFSEGGYIMLTPGSFVLPFSDRDFIDIGPTYGWSFGGGYMFARGKVFKATVGGVFEHTLLRFDDYDFANLGGHVIRVMPEARIGAGSNKVWGYGLMGAGVAGAFWNWRYDVPFFDDARGRRSAPGFNMQFGGGIQGIVYKNLFLGAEVDFDLGWFARDRDQGFWLERDRDGFEIHQVAVEFLLGWYF